MSYYSRFEVTWDKPPKWETKAWHTLVHIVGRELAHDVLESGDIDIEMHADASEIAHFLRVGDCPEVTKDGVYGTTEISWRDREEVMKDFSYRTPGVKFTVHQFGEDDREFIFVYKDGESTTIRWDK